MAAFVIILMLTEHPWLSPGRMRGGLDVFIRAGGRKVENIVREDGKRR